MKLKEKNVLFFGAFFFFIIFLFFPSFSFSYTTECGENVNLGSSATKYCSSCCVPSDCCTKDEQGNCIPDSCCYTVPCCPCCEEYTCNAVWYEYRAESTGCGTKILRRKCKSVCGTPSECCTCGPCEVECENPEVIETCESWQKAKRDCEITKWGLGKPECKCEGECLEVPKNPRYYDNPEYPKDPFNPEKSKDPNNIFLPVKLDWDDVKGWKGGWKEEGEIKNCSKECVLSYKISFEQTTKDGYSTTIDESEYNYRDDPNAGACFLKSGDTINWHVKACCNPDGTNCGPESNFQFKTNYAPELIEPYDKDWNGTSSAENVPLPVSLKWCRVEKIKKQDAYYVSSYNLLFFVVENRERKCHPSRQSDGTCVPFTLVFPAVNTTDSIEYIEYSDETAGLFTKLSSYAWQVAACGALGAEQICSDYSQGWAFNTGTTTLKEISWFSPPNGSTVGFPVILEWKPPWGANSFQYQVYKGTLLVASGTTTDLRVDVTNKLNLDTQYKWRVRVCWDYKAKDCEDWPTEWWYFKTTGRPPKLETMKPVGGNIPIPVNFEWEDVPGAKSYRIKINELNLEKIVREAKFFLDYPDIRQETNYSWQVQTCAWENGTSCGNWSNLQTFKTFKLSAPSNPSPKENEEIFTYQMPMSFSWGAVSGARYYRYVINYVQKSPEEASECPTGKVIDKIISNNSDLVSLNCLGKYQWQVQACFDKDCQEAGDWSNLWNFTLSQKVPPGGGGLVPCGRDYDDPRTPWNEREPCQIKHLFLLLRNILDFLFWRVGLIILVLLVVVTGIIYYFSVFSPEILGEWAAIANIRSIWKYAGIGYGIIFLAWLVINLFLALLGYKFQIFGHWWEIKF